MFLHIKNIKSNCEYWTPVTFEDEPHSQELFYNIIQKVVDGMYESCNTTNNKIERYRIIEFDNKKWAVLYEFHCYDVILKERAIVQLWFLKMGESFFIGQPNFDDANKANSVMSTVLTITVLEQYKKLFEKSNEN